MAYLIYSEKFSLPPSTIVAALSTAVLTLAGAVVLSRYPRPVARLLLAAAEWPLLGRFARRLRLSARDYYRSMKAFKTATASTWLALNVFTVSQWFGSFVLLWALLGLYSVEANLLMILAILSSLTLVSHFVPTPGAAGFVEAVVGLSVGGSAAAAVLIWRLASFYVIFMFGPLAVWLIHPSQRTTAPRDEFANASAPKRSSRL